LGANRDANAEHKQGRRAPVALRFSLTPMPFGRNPLRNLAPAPAITTSGAALWIADKISVFGKRMLFGEARFSWGAHAPTLGLKLTDT
jgi:hypothetical protein